MRGLILAVGSLLLAATALGGQTATKGKTGTLKVVVTGMEKAEGSLKIALNNSLENYKSREDGKAFRGASVKVDSQEKMVHTFKDVPWGEYAVKLFHDANNNGKLDTNFLGMPKEDYGFSNNVRGRFGPPAYDKAKFEFSHEMQEIAIQVR